MKPLRDNDFKLKSILEVCHLVPFNLRFSIFNFQFAMLFAVLALGSWSFAEEPTPTAAPVPSAEDAYKRGVAYLLTTQNKDGSWGTFESARPDEVYTDTIASYRAFLDATTGLCVEALITPAKTNKDAAKALEKAIKFLIKSPPVLRASGMVFYNVWTHIYVLDAMNAVLNEEKLSSFHSDAKIVAKRQVDGFAKLQGCEGGFGYYDFDLGGVQPAGRESTSFTTAAALLALDGAKSAGVDVPEAMVKDALKSLTRLRGGDGAYIYGTYLLDRPKHFANREKGSIGRSQVCNLTLWRLKTGLVTQKDLSAGLDNLLKDHAFIEMGKGRPIPHESWYCTAGYYFLFGHYYAARVAKELPSDEAKKYLGSLKDILCRLQEPDGSWWDYPLYGYYKAYGTAFALMTLEMANEPAVVKGEGSGK